MVKMAISSKDICIGTITGAHGVHGAVRIRVYSDDAECLLNYKKLKDHEGRLFTVKKLRIHKGQIAIVKFNEVGNRTQAEELSQAELFINRSQMPDLELDEFYITDLIGLKVKSSKGVELGTIKSVENNGAGDFLTLAEKPTTIPFTHEAVPEVYVKEGYVVIDEDALLEAEAA